MMATNLLQEEPAGKPWASEYVRTWEPRPFDPVEYEEWARQPRLLRIRAILPVHPQTTLNHSDFIDPGLRRNRP